jgi:hypothetical protein
MKWVHAVVAAAFIGIVHANDEVELTRDVGSGFRMVIKSLPTGPGPFESVAQYHYLFYRDIELGQYDSYSVAPSGKYALLQDAPTGDIVLFASAATQRRVVAKFSGSLARDYVWREGRHEATIRFEDHTSLRIALSVHRSTP